MARSSSSSSLVSLTSFRSSPLALLAALALAALLAFACDDSDPTPVATTGLETVTPNPTLVATASPDELIEIQIGDLVIHAEAAVTPEERAQGLSDRDSMALDAGMLFVFSEERMPSFTMRRMRFPLDFIWVSADRRVVDLTENVPNPNAPGEEINDISPSVNVLYVVEVNAGVIAGNGIEIGDEVTFDRDPAFGG